jgi:uncharacterized membrane protein YkvA (DUF1232 family)
MGGRMSDMIGLFKLMLILSFGLALAVLVVFSMPKSPLRDAILPYAKLGVVVLCGIYCVSPVDILPEIVLGPFGLIDDLGSFWMGISTLFSLFNKPKEIQHR